MTPEFRYALELLLLTSAYGVADLAVRKDGFLRVLKRMGVSGERPAMFLWIVPCLALAPFWRWDPAAQGEGLRVLATALSAMLAWQAATRDVDPVVGETRAFSRLLAVAAAAGVYASPAFLLGAGFLFTTPFGLWQHHAALPMRLLQALMAHAVLVPLAAPAALVPLASPPAAPAGLFRDPAVAVFFVLTMVISHYLITALAKGMLGPKWHSWVTENRLHHLAASAYSWGWARFLPWTAWRRVIASLKRVEKPLQTAAFALELLSPLALLHPRAAIGFCLAWAGFHMGVFAVSGLLFWDWVVADLAVACAVALLPAPVADQVFGPASVGAALLFMLAFPLRHKLWKPMPLGWFDTPFTQRVHWRVRGASGREYGLYNDFMCPHERLYGKVHGCFLAPVPVVTYHLGEVWKHDLRDAIRAAGPDLGRLEEVRRRFGITPRCAERTERHLAYLRLFFHRLNRGARKHVLPRWLRWLKAPGDQIYYWGDLPPYRGQEIAAQVSLHYREEYFDGEALRRLREEVLAEIEIGGDVRLPAEAAREPAPGEIDEFLLGFAAGRLIDLPGFGGGYVRGDDGRPGLVAGGSP